MSLEPNPIYTVRKADLVLRLEDKYHLVTYGVEEPRCANPRIEEEFRQSPLSNAVGLFITRPTVVQYPLTRELLKEHLSLASLVRVENEELGEQTEVIEENLTTTLTYWDFSNFDEKVIGKSARKNWLEELYKLVCFLGKPDYEQEFVEHDERKKKLFEIFEGIEVDESIERIQERAKNYDRLFVIVSPNSHKVDYIGYGHDCWSVHVELTTTIESIWGVKENLMQ
jgi:hypothetical protein